MKEFKQIVKDINDKKLNNIYVLDGEEPYYIDVLTDLFEEKVLEPHEKDFNLSVLYGKDTEWSTIVNECRSYPSFAEKRLVIVKEAAQLKGLNELEPYLANPSATTILVIAHKYKKVDGRSKLLSTAKKKGVYATFDKIKEHAIGDWILNFCHEKKLKISSPNAELLAAYLGNDLQKIANEIEKVSINIEEGKEITEDLIEKYIGISKDYNIFQFPTALLERNTEKAFTIANYFIANPKDNPMVVITATVYGQFAKLYQYHYAQQLPQAEIAAQLKIPPFYVKDYVAAAKKYNLSQTMQVIHLLHEYNLNAIGMNVAKSDMNLLKEMTAKILAI